MMTLRSLPTAPYYPWGPTVGAVRSSKGVRPLTGIGTRGWTPTAALFLLLAAAVFSSEAPAATLCSSSKGHDGAWWSYRQIDGKRCWYRGFPGKAKDSLAWARQYEPREPTLPPPMKRKREEQRPQPAPEEQPQQPAPVRIIQTSRQPPLTEQALLASVRPKVWPEVTTAAAAETILEVPLPLERPKNLNGPTPSSLIVMSVLILFLFMTALFTRREEWP